MTAIPIPSHAGAAVFARVDLGPSVLRSIESLLFKPMRELRILLDERSFRLVAGTADGPLLLHVPSGDDLPFRQLVIDGSNPRTVGLEGLYTQATLTFYEIDLS